MYSRCSMLFKHKVTSHFTKPDSADATTDRLRDMHSPSKNNQNYTSKNRLYTFIVHHLTPVKLIICYRKTDQFHYCNFI